MPDAEDLTRERIVNLGFDALALWEKAERDFAAASKELAGAREGVDVAEQALEARTAELAMAIEGGNAQERAHRLTLACTADRVWDARHNTQVMARVLVRELETKVAVAVEQMRRERHTLGFVQTLLAGLAGDEPRVVDLAGRMGPR